MGQLSALLAGKNVLVVENEWLIADDLTRALMAEGAQVVGPAASVSEALLLLRTASVDIAVLDIHLDRGGNVYPVAEALRQRGVPFMFATGYSKTSVRRDFERVPHLTKPFEPAAVGRKLFELSAGRGTSAAHVR